MTHSILDYELRLNGKSILLKNATGEEVLAVAHHYLSQGTTMIRTGRWLERVAASVPDGKRVGEVMGVKELERLQATSRKEAA
ncbi:MULTISPECIES: hypothetical protein [unclassified Chelatococcus]|uniref:hypothetical protein n=1 Tax=unclassified Chelatococcus TaxID=2638111 RepID=UPI001BD135E6|nr:MULTISPECIES: hypothetical protein [unclassified Chelatococcus]CAH1665552.1 hypothetical protein CHELA41_22683 [Hyphomicrobiales bacterium]MBS7737736.1 hypothetical protein [Chelatococcus sp. HY11]MBX3547225.1 hypothetical protein [Chelatococcus sp.]MCO5077136.1 hypothetical protein [Chelatococcus sp.]CAH1681261.1 hypothetical protein CHELA20_52236 [Hyphomicrobiales bacterium]